MQQTQIHIIKRQTVTFQSPQTNFIQYPPKQNFRNFVKIFKLFLTFGSISYVFEVLLFSTEKKSKNLFQKINLRKFYSYLHKHRSNGTYYFWKLIKTMYLSQPSHFQYFRSLLSTVNKLYFFALNILWVLCFQYGVDERVNLPWKID